MPGCYAFPIQGTVLDAGCFISCPMMARVIKVAYLT